MAHLSLSQPAPLVPTLPDAAQPRTLKYDLTTDPLRAGDQLVVLHKCLGFPKRARLPIAGYSELRDPDGTLVAVTAYVLPMTYTADVKAYTERDFHQYPCALQAEQWFPGARPVVLVQVCLTEYRDCLRLERAAPAVAQHMGAYSATAAGLGFAINGDTLRQAA